METNLQLYECGSLIKEIEARAEANGGEIGDADLEALVVAQTTSMAKLGKLCGFIKFVEGTIDLCKQEEQRLAARRKAAEKKLEAIERFLVPFVAQYRAEKGHPLTVGTFQLSTRKSQSVQITDVAFGLEETSRQWCNEQVSYTPDKARIKDALKAGTEIPGARLVQNESLQVR